ncbi:hypothetical protein GUJ93_ZPchr0012g20628 [Zizania palustris]|uniref:Uncharacterized protein n=1 Tax=Zizania palustris TaxID=103762 RepID=A0A8J5WGQ7_ZIZPA|nr:hypothetical protein GUJ93_ZPchr0012g20628 [Zizania palustris]
MRSVTQRKHVRLTYGAHYLVAHLSAVRSTRYKNGRTTARARAVQSLFLSRLFPNLLSPLPESSRGSGHRRSRDAQIHPIREAFSERGCTDISNPTPPSPPRAFSRRHPPTRVEPLRFDQIR